MSQAPPAPVAGHSDVIEPLVRAVGWFRYCVLALTLLVNALRFGQAQHPLLLVLFCLLMAAATVAAQWAYREPERRLIGVLALDLGFTVLLTGLSPLVLGTGVLPVTAFWATGAPLAIAICRGWLAGTISALLLVMLEFFLVPSADPTAWGTLLALVLAVAALGWTVDQLRHNTNENAQVHATAAALAERQRLARIVHDGVLQVLAMVEREGSQLGPRGAMLARQAHEQEAALRSLIQEKDLSVDSRDPKDMTHRNFSVLLDRHASPTVTVSTPADPLLLVSQRAAELDAAISEALNNVAKHAGPQARAWVFLENDGDHLMVSIRDNGVGGNPQAFAQAMESGRMGMRHSIYGRVAELGGTATLRTAPGRGVEWEFRIPLDL